eukprot:TRINITY_DN1494_c0_g1_i1.p1 TRINITY_DN1494_c0_g1~~TRINITY_DN1494_c0_g1_i1.p1  ORF type:complete len:445 (-),score=38.49 TRINITY_DN1494_c0_g1_i1:543-1877(-)
MPITKFRFQNLSEQQKQEITITEFIRIIKVRNRPINTDEFCRKTMVPSIYKEYSISYLKAKTMEATQSLELLKEGNGALNRDALNYIKDNISASQLCVISNGGKVGLGKSTFENALIYSLLHQSKQEGHRQKGNSYFKATESATSVTKGVNIQKEILDNPKGGKVLLMDIPGTGALTKKEEENSVKERTLSYLTFACLTSSVMCFHISNRIDDESIGHLKALMEVAGSLKARIDGIVLPLLVIILRDTNSGKIIIEEKEFSGEELLNYIKSTRDVDIKALFHNCVIFPMPTIPKKFLNNKDCKRIFEGKFGEQLSKFMERVLKEKFKFGLLREVDNKRYIQIVDIVYCGLVSENGYKIITEALKTPSEKMTSLVKNVGAVLGTLAASFAMAFIRKIIQGKQSNLFYCVVLFLKNLLIYVCQQFFDTANFCLTNMVSGKLILILD